jgi:hypothetical protein
VRWWRNLKRGAAAIDSRQLLRVSAWLAVIAALTGCTAQSDRSCTLALTTSLPLWPMVHNTKLAVPATLKNVPLMLTVDTGAAATTLDSQAVRAEDFIGQVGGTGVGGNFTAGVALFRGLQIGRLSGSIAAVAGGLPPGLSSQGVAGNLGMDVLGNYDVDLDLWGWRLTMYSAQGACQAPAVTMEPPLYTVDLVSAGWGDRRPHVRVGIGGLTFLAVIDTGSTGMVISGNVAELLGLTGAALQADRIIPVSGFGPATVLGRVHVLDSLTIGDLTLHHVPATVLSEEFDPGVGVILGLDLAQRVHLWISRSSHRLVMQYPPTASPALPAGLN